MMLRLFGCRLLELLKGITLRRHGGCYSRVAQFIGLNSNLVVYMYQVEWFDEKGFSAEEGKNPTPAFKSQVDKDNIDLVLLSHTEEHCLECAPPLCYGNCSLYVERPDKKCRKVFYGVAKNHKVSGLFPYGADVRFRRWGKLTLQLYGKGMTIETINRIGRANTSLVKVADTVSTLLSPFNKKRTVNGTVNFYRNKFLFDLKPEKGFRFDDFLIECYSFESTAFNLHIQNNRYDDYHFKTSVVIQPGQNLIKIPVKNFKYVDDVVVGSIIVFPENDLEARLIFTWLDFVKYKVKAGEGSITAKPAAKVKCVAWDLDNTLWKGVFIESKPEDLVLNPDAVAAIKKFDEMGVLQTIASKNTHADVWPFIESTGLADYFLYPAINWGQKSENLKSVADLLNINIDTFVLIDDSPFERSEVAGALPQVRTYADTMINDLFALPEFDFPITEESRKRRSYYMIEQKRMQIEAKYAGNYKEFLRNCQITLNIFTPQQEQHVARCMELILRTNQLNLSSRRHSADSFNALMADDKYYKFTLDVTDQFGAYGIIGFAVIEKGEDSFTIVDFVMSCRVQQKMIEHAFIAWLTDKMRTEGKSVLWADYVKTSRNGKMLAVFEELQFTKQEIDSEKYRLCFDIVGTKLENDIITVEVN
jgi:FkbH-like protein